MKFQEAIELLEKQDKPIRAKYWVEKVHVSKASLQDLRKDSRNAKFVFITNGTDWRQRWQPYLADFGSEWEVYGEEEQTCAPDEFAF